ncbi:MAG: type II toxin-antitoxin system RelE/ParE family toxin [Candidatus Omnitrophota bacterium]|jgi:mRNA interferase RelE/StbE|nr:type II toxin-antitoxin system RelE/ParE family toxin [Candidatus Omnitrophota bacterium]
MKYRIKIIPKAEKDLDAVTGRDFDAVKKRILLLSENPRPFGSKKLTDEGGYRIRSGDFRILYRIDDMVKEVIIYRIRHRKEVYK